MATKKQTTKLDPSAYEAIENAGREGLVLSNYSSALGLTVSELQALADKDPKLSKAIELAMSFALGYHTERLINPPPGSQSQLTLSFLKAHWPSIYAVDNKTTSGGRGGTEVKEVTLQDQNNFQHTLFSFLHSDAKQNLESGQTFAEYVDHLGGIVRSMEVRGYDK